jgi:hypothetical protein
MQLAHAYIQLNNKGPHEPELDALQPLPDPEKTMTREVLVVLQLGTDNKDVLELIRRCIVYWEDLLVTVESTCAWMKAMVVNNSECR